jgi:hypothetical protein
VIKSREEKRPETGDRLFAVKITDKTDVTDDIDGVLAIIELTGSLS